LHARAIRRLRESLGEVGPEQVAEMRKALVAFAKPKMAKAAIPAKAAPAERAANGGRVIDYAQASKRQLAVAAIKPARPIKVEEPIEHEAIAAAR
jgi:hypothetical protein